MALGGQGVFIGAEKPGIPQHGQEAVGKIGGFGDALQVQKAEAAVEVGGGRTVLLKYVGHLAKGQGGDFVHAVLQNLKHVGGGPIGIVQGVPVAEGQPPFGVVDLHGVILHNLQHVIHALGGTAGHQLQVGKGPGGTRGPGRDVAVGIAFCSGSVVGQAVGVGGQEIQRNVICPAMVPQGGEPIMGSGHRGAADFVIGAHRLHRPGGDLV